jgi:hypothetical protein
VVREKAIMVKVLEKRQTKIKDWSIDFINYFRETGFLNQYKSISTEYIVRLLMQWNNETFYIFKDLCIISDICEFYEDSFLAEEQNGKIISPSYELNLLALLDPKRIWWSEREVIYEKNNNYIKTLERLSEISRFSFLPENIKVIESHLKDLLYIDFKLNGKQYRIHALSESNNFSVDLKILKAINHIISDTGLSFQSFSINDEYNSTYIISLTEAEKQKIEEERNWQFSLA